MFNSDSWLPRHIKLYHPQHLQVAKNLTVRSAPQPVEPAPGREFNANKDSVEDLAAYPFFEHVENIADSECEQSPSLRPWTETCPGSGGPLSDYITEPLEWDAQGFLETNQ